MPVKNKPTDFHLGLFCDKVLKKILSSYGIKEWSVLPFFSLNKIVLDLNQRTNTSRKVLIKSGKNIYFLKEVPWYCSNKNFVEGQLDFIEFLRARKMPVLEIIKNKKKRPFVSLRNKYYILSKFVEGYSWHRDPKEAYNAGYILGRFHNFSLKYLKANKKRLAKFNEDVFNLAKKFLNLVNRYLSNSFPQKNLKKYLDFSHKLLSKVHSSATRKGYYNLKVVVHGDYNPFNMVFSKDKKVLLITDFDNFSVDNPSHDIAEGLVRFSYLKYGKVTSNYVDIPIKYNKEQARAFIKGYKKSNKSMFLLVKSYLIEVCVSLAIEFSALGILCGFYGEDKINLLLRSLKIVEKETKNLFKNLNL